MLYVSSQFNEWIITAQYKVYVIRLSLLIVCFGVIKATYTLLLQNNYNSLLMGIETFYVMLNKYN